MSQARKSVQVFSLAIGGYREDERAGNVVAFLVKCCVIMNCAYIERYKIDTKNTEKWYNLKTIGIGSQEVRVFRSGFAGPAQLLNPKRLPINMAAVF